MTARRAVVGREAVARREQQRTDHRRMQCREIAAARAFEPRSRSSQAPRAGVVRGAKKKRPAPLRSRAAVRSRRRGSALRRLAVRRLDRRVDPAGRAVGGREVGELFRDRLAQRPVAVSRDAPAFLAAAVRDCTMPRYAR